MPVLVAAVANTTVTAIADPHKDLPKKFFIRMRKSVKEPKSFQWEHFVVVFGIFFFSRFSFYIARSLFGLSSRFHFNANCK